MYSTRSGLILGFHGCDKSVAEDILNNKTELNFSINSYDWLGHGIYFWENSPSRAMEFAKFLRDHPSKSKKPIQEPSVIGAVINLGHCLDLLDYQMLSTLKITYDVFKQAMEKQGKKLPENKNVGSSKDLLLRELDCAVIETVHEISSSKTGNNFDSVRGVFWEGDTIYPYAGFREKDHIQICIRNPNCIKGYFLPRSIYSKYNKV